MKEMKYFLKILKVKICTGEKNWLIAKDVIAMDVSREKARKAKIEN